MTWPTLANDADIGSCLRLMHRFDEAEPVLLAAVKGLAASRGENLYLTQAAMADLRDLYSDRGDTANATLWATKVRH